MATNKYIILQNSNASLVRRFKAIAMKPRSTRTDSMEYTLDGSPDKASGPIIRTFSYVLRVPQDDPADSSYGMMSELTTLFNLTNPNATPNDILTLTDHYNQTHQCYFMGELAPEPLTTMLEGSNAWHIVEINLQEIPA